jgi:oxygen-independent coproporphyrinogen-3 oxidase
VKFLERTTGYGVKFFLRTTNGGYGNGKYGIFMQSIYIHIPFCVKKCNYCAFASYPAASAAQEKYISVLAKEMALRRNFPAQTLYIGGGTPSFLGAELLEKLLTETEKNFGPIKNFIESTFEVNPESVTEEKLKILKKYGFNRISVGAQTFDDDGLKILGRAHDRKTFFDAYDKIKSAGFTNINIDLIAGFPRQTFEGFEKDIREIISLSPVHISVYGLQIEEGTKIFETGFNPDQILMRKMLEHARAALQAASYKHYEISNYAKPGFESRHNNNYWQSGEYIGLGFAAASFVNGKRFSNPENLEKYLENPGKPEFEEVLTGKEKLGENIIIGLRRLDGIAAADEIEKNFGREIKNLIAAGMLEKAGGKIKLTEEGIFLSNEVFENFVAPFYET